MKQHEQRTLRLWRCPECDRTVRLPGKITSRMCRCMGEATLMSLQPTDRIRTFDVDAFVTYQADEFATPTEAELVENIPQHLMPVGPSEEELAAKAAKPRRGKAYLRTEIDEEPDVQKESVEKSTDQAADEFGAGLNDDADTTPPQADVRASRPTEPPEAAQQADSDTAHTGRKKKRRRRRRGRGGRRDGDQAGGDQLDSDQSASDNAHSESVQDASSANKDAQVDQSTSEGGNRSDSEEKTGAGKKRRRRRRRRGRGRTNPDSGPSDTASGESRDRPDSDVDTTE